MQQTGTVDGWEGEGVEEADAAPVGVNETAAVAAAGKDDVELLGAVSWLCCSSVAAGAGVEAAAVHVDDFSEDVGASGAVTVTGLVADEPSVEELSVAEAATDLASW